MYKPNPLSYIGNKSTPTSYYLKQLGFDEYSQTIMEFAINRIGAEQISNLLLSTLTASNFYLNKSKFNEQWERTSKNLEWDYDFIEAERIKSGIEKINVTEDILLAGMSKNQIPLYKNHTKAEFLAYYQNKFWEEIAAQANRFTDYFESFLITFQEYPEVIFLIADLIGFDLESKKFTVKLDKTKETLLENSGKWISTSYQEHIKTNPILDPELANHMESIGEIKSDTDSDILNEAVKKRQHIVYFRRGLAMAKGQQLEKKTAIEIVQFIIDKTEKEFGLTNLQNQLKSKIVKIINRLESSDIDVASNITKLLNLMDKFVAEL